MENQVAAPEKIRMIRLVEIDYLRAYAVAFVVFLHVVGAYMGMYPGAEKFFRNTDFGTGVDVFFAISGYVIAKNLRFLWLSTAAPLSEKLGRALVFYQKRFVRLWPSAAFWLVVGVSLSFVFHQTGFWPNRTEALQTLISGIVYFSNFQQYYQPSVLGYFWSLSVEWQFYLVLPLLLAFVSRNIWRVGILMFLMVVALIVQPGGAGWWMFRFDGIVLGIICFVALDLIGVRTPRYRVLELRTGRVVMIVCLLAAIAVLPAAVVPSRLGSLFSSACAAVLVVLASQNRGYISTLGLRPFFEWLGARSYSVYLCHFPCLLVVRSVQAHFIGVQGVLHPTRFEAAVAVLGTLCMVAIASELGYRLIERPSHEASQAIRYGEDGK